jgi:hypothetical protein
MNSDRNPWLILLLWAAADLAVILPGGVLTQVQRADAAIRARVMDSPYERLCYICGKPAVHQAAYTDGSTRYFCKEHRPPEKMRATTEGDKGSSQFSPRSILLMLAAVFGIGTLRAIVHVLSDGLRLAPTYLGAFGAIGVAVGAWYWFGSLL